MQYIAKVFENTNIFIGKSRLMQEGMFWNSGL
jgi:hypothetical protein